MATGWHKSAASNAAQSARMKGKAHPHRGHTVSAATRAKISAALKGKPHKGHAISAATRAKISAALKKRYAALRGNKEYKPRHKVLLRGYRTKKFHSGTNRLIRSTLIRKRTGLIHQPRHRRSKIKVHRTVRHHRVWRKRKRR
jgi:hypothetical protein